MDIMNDKTKQLIEAYEAIIFGKDGIGLINDYYFNLESYLDNELKELKQLKKELGIED